MNKKIAVYPGSFDPITNGHINLIERALKLFDKVVIGVLDNPNKKTWFTPLERVEMIEIIFSDKEYKERIEIKAFKGLLIDFMSENNINITIRGLRAVSDYEYELQMSLTNNAISNEVLETIFLAASRDNLYLSSSIVKEIALNDGDISLFVDEKIKSKIKKRGIKKREE